MARGSDPVVAFNYPVRERHAARVPVQRGRTPDSTIKLTRHAARVASFFETTLIILLLLGKI